MWKMVIADDEQVIRSGLRKLLDWARLGIEIIGEADNGERLLREIEEKKPDIVISDIKMPVLTGLDVIRQCSEKKPAPKFIFISGYEEFAFAREAMYYGAVDYLLKPVGIEDFERAAKKAIRLLMDYQTVSIFQGEKEELQQIFEQVNDGYEYVEEDLYRRFAKEKVDVTNHFFVGVCFGMIADEEQREQMSYEQIGLFRFSVYNKIAANFRQNRLGFVIKKEEYFCDMMAAIPFNHRTDYVEVILMPLKNQIEEQTGTRLCMGIGEPADIISFWKGSYKSAKFACELYYFGEQDVIDYSRLNRKYTVTFEDYNRILEEVFQQIAARDEAALESIAQALAVIADIHYGNRYAAVNRILLFTSSLLERLFAVALLEGDVVQRQNDVQEGIRYLDTYRQVCSWLLSYYDALIQEIYRSRSRLSVEIMTVQRYIAEHYHQDLSLKELAGVACISQNYFSNRFKKETGENYKSFVTRIRMEEAIRLVLKTDMKTYEIAAAVGYNNVRCFVDAFKGIYRISPMEYRKKNRV